MQQQLALEPPVQRAFDQIWTQLPERQNGMSSSWWFFILFPEGEEGYGPRQMMFTLSTRAGDRMRVNDTWTPGLDPDREIENGVDKFPVMAVGWDGDDERVDEHVINEPVEATLRDGSIAAWHERDGQRRGGEIRATTDPRLGLEAEFVSDQCDVQFTAWGDHDADIASPVEATDIETPAGGTHLVAWRRMPFEGTFDLPGGREELSGMAYFQRVCLNIPLFPWKWVWALFPDGSAFSVMIPYVGPQLLRRGYTLFDSNTAERATIPVQQSGMWEWGDTGERVEFDSVSVTPVVEDEAHPDFVVEASNDDGDDIRFLADTYGHARNYIDRPVLGDRVETHWSYNEYLVRTDGLQGTVDGQSVTGEAMGQGFGTLEYAWGLGL